MPDKKFELGDYIEVKDRIRIFYELYPGGRLVTSQVFTEMGPDGTPRVLVRAEAYRTTDDPLPGVGWSWMALPGTTPYTRGSEVENAETSAWGRAIASLGILIDRSIASAQEVANKAGQPDATPVVAAAIAKDRDDGSLIGTAEVGKVGSGADFELRQSPEGPVMAFRLTQGRKGWKVIAHGAMATSLATIKPVGQLVSVWGSMQDETMPIAGGRTATYQVVNLERIKGADFELPAQVTPEEAFDAAEREATYAAAAIVGVGPNTETLPLPLADISEEEAAAIVAQELQEAAG